MLFFVPFFFSSCLLVLVSLSHFLHKDFACDGCPHMMLVVVVLICVASAIEMKGMSFTGDRYCHQVPMDSDSSLRSLRHLKSTGCNFVAIVVTWYQKTYDANKIFPLNRPFQAYDVAGSFWNYTFVSETPRAVVTAIREAHKLGMKVLLKPHIDLINSQVYSVLFCY